MLAEAAKELELTTTAGAATARLGGATAGLFNNRATAARLRSGAGRFDSRAGRLFDFSRTAAARLDFGSTTATATVVATQVLEEGVGLAFEGHRRNHQGHHSEGGSQHKTLAHHKSSN
jgi:hypothetical protein